MLEIRYNFVGAGHQVRAAAAAANLGSNVLLVP